ncbi:nuclear transport factor 2 family protein [Agromyces sp. LHK192]|uniref:YybH family protein n=1 Tax=Agromyces sp. LHK192 TaxID=2498704 RepID=UPI000FD9AE6B|nr:nuclear transport factor 2 family protein [Agromyces sp. LHK192]
MTDEHLTDERPDVPAALRAFIDTTNRGDTDAFLAVFTDDASLDDWGRVFHGRDGIASWNETDNIGKQSHFELVGVEPTDDPDTVIATLEVSGNGYNGTGPITFTSVGDRLSRVVIAPTD